MKNGELITSKPVAFSKGSSENPVSWDDVVEKFMDCVSHSVKHLQERDIEKVVDMIKNLEKVTDVSLIIQLLH